MSRLDVDTYTIDDMTIHRVVELVAPFMPATEMLPALTSEVLDENRGWLGSQLAENNYFVLTYQSFVVRTPHHTVVVDTGLGNDKDRGRPEWHRKTDDQFLSGLARVGVRPEDVDYVICTHLHADHVGWNTRLVQGRWQPTFPRARYILHRDELAATAGRHRESGDQPYADSILPILDAGLADVVDEDFSIGDHGRLLLTAGHTAGHVAVRFGRRRDRVVFSGDLLHVALQIRYPELSFFKDLDPRAAAVTRRAFLERYAETDTVCCTGHIPTSGPATVRRRGDGFALAASRGT
ncbi:MBL fold metallo-hydrolase [Nocardioides sp. KIGAM211]|uniref:MBL fold metallo-hydrolase n=1 Tax=Nocardioides luti TaxID=2761101 RepID=A0A7X0VB38_9ACTN|nr:MBL fold metallo-hydrolase [Nocardioides luti]MBB6627567.1 MBL fold metallo-hydrolase [Nocardioides luti]